MIHLSCLAKVRYHNMCPLKFKMTFLFASFTMVKITEHECEYVLMHISHHLQAIFICLFIPTIFITAFLLENPKFRHWGKM